MDKDVVMNKLDGLSRCIARIEDKNPHSLPELQLDLDLQDVIVLNLERAVQICVDIGMHILSSSDFVLPDTMAETFSVLAEKKIISSDTSLMMIKAVGFRNVAVHAYQAIDWVIVDKIINHHIDDFRKFAKEIYCELHSVGD